MLTAGSLGDRFGRRPALLVGLGGFAAGQRRRGAASSSADALIAVRFVDGRVRRADLPDHAVDHHERLPRPRASGPRRSASGARSPASASRSARSPAGCCSPTSAGRRCSSRWCRSRWSPLVARRGLVPESRDPARPGSTCPAWSLSSAADRRCSSTRSSRRPAAAGPHPLTLAGFAVAAVLAAAFVADRAPRGRTRCSTSRCSARRPSRPPAASVTVAFFALFGFIFLVTQYFQFIRGYGTLSTGVRILPVAITIALGSVVGVALAGRLGTRAVVDDRAGAARRRRSPGSRCRRRSCPTPQIVGQMVLMGLGLGLTTAPATESILSVLPAGQGRRRLGGQRRHPGGRRHARRGRPRQRLHLDLYASHLAARRVRRAAGPGLGEAAQRVGRRRARRWRPGTGAGCGYR